MEWPDWDLCDLIKNIDLANYNLLRKAQKSSACFQWELKQEGQNMEASLLAWGP